MMPLVYGLWMDVLSYPASQEENAYTEPLPDGYSEEVMKFYEEIKSREL